MAVIVDVAEAIAVALTAYNFSLPFVAEVTFTPIYDLKTMKELYVPVVPKAREWSGATRNLKQDEMQIDVGIQKKLLVGDQVEIGTLMDLVEEMIAFIFETDRFGVGRVTSVENVPIFAPDLLSNYRQFTSVLTITLRRLV